MLHRINMLKQFCILTIHGPALGRLSLVLGLWLSLAVGAHAMASEPLKVCGITVNSDNEFKAMQRALGDLAVSVELIEIRAHGGFDPDAWIDETCRKNIQCDVVILSGHFGGIFGNEKLPILLPLTTLERVSCSERCPGLFRNPKEVYLLGCTSLSDEDPYGFGLSQLRRLNIETLAVPAYVQANYSHFERMRRVFANVPRIYGYADVGPTGPQVEAAFFRSILRQRPYFAHLRSAARQDLLGVNPDRIAQLRQTSGANLDSDLQKDVGRVCRAQYGDGLATRVDALADLLLDRDGYRHLNFVMRSLAEDAELSRAFAKLAGLRLEMLRAKVLAWQQPLMPIAMQLEAFQLAIVLRFQEEVDAVAAMATVINRVHQLSWGATKGAAAICFTAESAPALKKAMTANLFRNVDDDFALNVLDCVHAGDKGLRQKLEFMAEHHALDYRRNMATRILRFLNSPGQ